jgi:hypothetical protein
MEAERGTPPGVTPMCSFSLNSCGHANVQGRAGRVEPGGGGLVGAAGSRRSPQDPHCTSPPHPPKQRTRPASSPQHRPPAHLDGHVLEAAVHVAHLHRAAAQPLHPLELILAQCLAGRGGEAEGERAVARRAVHEEVSRLPRVPPTAGKALVGRPVGSSGAPSRHPPPPPARCGSAAGRASP